MKPRGHEDVYLELSEQPVPDSSEPYRLLRFIRDRLEAPVRFTDECGALELQPAIDDRWRQLCRESFEVDSEVVDVLEYATLEDSLEFHYVTLGFHTELRHHAVNIKTWYARAAAQFVDLVAAFRAPYCPPEDRPKHFPDSSVRTAEQLARMTLAKCSPSMLAFGLDEHVLGLMAREIEVDLVDSLVGSGEVRVAVDCMTDVGYSGGEPTSFLAFIWQRAAVHAYPVPEDQARRIGVIQSTSDFLQGFSRANRDDPESTPMRLAEPDMNQTQRREWPFGQVHLPV